MAWWKFGRHSSLKPEFLAREIFDIFVAQGVRNDLDAPDLFSVDVSVRTKLAEKLQAYRTGAVLYALVSLSRAVAKARAILKSYEDVIKSEALREAGAAMIELDALRRADDLPLTWALGWLAGAALLKRTRLRLEWCVSIG